MFKRRKSKGLVVKPGESITIKLFDKCEGCDVIDKCEYLGECQKNGYERIEKAYNNLKTARKDIDVFLSREGLTFEGYQEKAILFDEAYENLMNVLAEVFDKCGSLTKTEQNQ